MMMTMNSDSKVTYVGNDDYADDAEDGKETSCTMIATFATRGRGSKVECVFVLLILRCGIFQFHATICFS